MAKLGQLLVARGWITVQQLTRALKNQSVVGGRLGTCLLDMDVISEDLLLKGLSEQLGVPAAVVDDLRAIPEEVRELLAPRLARRCRAVPFRAVGGRLDVAMLDARNLACQDEIAFATGKRVQVHVANEIRIFEALDKYYDEECPSRFSLLIDRINRTRYLWDRDGVADIPPSGVEIAPDDPLGAAGDLFAPAPHIEPPPLPEPALPATPWRSRVPMPPALSLAPARSASPPAEPGRAPALPALPAIARAGGAAPAVQPLPEPAFEGEAEEQPAPAAHPAPAPAPRALAAEPAAVPRAPLPPRSVPLTAQERAALSRGAAARRAAPPEASLASLDELTAALEPAREPEEVGRAVLALLASRYGRSALFQVGRERTTGWLAGAGVEPEALARFAVAYDQPSLFLNLRQGGSGLYIGPLPPMPAHRELARTWGGEMPRECVLVPVRIKDRLITVIYADTPVLPSGGLHLDELRRLAAATADALGRCILYKKQAGTAV